MALLAGMGVEALERGDQPIARTPVAARPRSPPSSALLIVLARFILQPHDVLIFGGRGHQRSGGWLFGSQPASCLLALLLIPASLDSSDRRRAPDAGALSRLAEYAFQRSFSARVVSWGSALPISQLLAFQADEVAPGRSLSISQIFFDPPDIVALRARFDRLGMDAAAQFHALDAVKKQETLMPNLALTWGIPTIDGFGGGLTPSRAYAQYSRHCCCQGCRAGGRRPAGRTHGAARLLGRMHSRSALAAGHRYTISHRRQSL